MKATTDTEMKIAVLSGKGGTGKTLISVNLAAAAARAIYLDCDVEEPNGHLFLKPENIHKKEVRVLVPRVDKDLCDGCKKCVDFCAFNALAHTGKGLMIFDSICHSCGGCSLVCPRGALSEVERPVGQVEVGRSRDLLIYTGILNPGEVHSTTIIESLLREVQGSEELVIIDAAPGSACNAMESIKDADYVILVAEPSIFGRHNLAMVHELVEVFNKPLGVVLNKLRTGPNPSEDYCKEKGLRILGRLDFDYELGHLSSAGRVAARESESYRQIFGELLEEVVREAASHP